MLGRYKGFPEVTHGRARFIHQGSIGDVQQSMLSSFHQLNQETRRLNAIAPHMSLDCEVGFDFGVAEDMVFNYLDKQELDRFRKAINKEELPIIDLFCAVHYHIVSKKGKRVPLKFDYHLIRFIFHRNRVNLRIRHERGPQRVPLEELITFVVNRVNEELSQNQLEPLELVYLRTL